ncbi:hypothetical protein [Umezawaea sp. NPDC059074]|uniref:hypothetical protein n=1 Tax=Umezawaea sp. NPDC059074 TaxID=3346716 RepID=UPI0036C63D78
MDVAVLNQMITASAALLGAGVGAATTASVARFTSKRSIEAERLKEKRAIEVRTAESCSSAFSELRVHASSFASSVAYDVRKDILAAQRKFNDSVQRTSLILIHAPRALREGLKLPFDLVWLALEIGSYGEQEGLHFNHPLVIIAEASDYAQSLIACSLHAEIHSGLTREMAEYEVALKEYDYRLGNIGDIESRLNGIDVMEDFTRPDQEVFDARVVKWYEKHPQFRNDHL